MSLDERDKITELKSDGMSLRAIAKELGRSPSTLSRELKRNATASYKLYLSHRAHERAAARKKVRQTCSAINRAIGSISNFEDGTMILDGQRVFTDIRITFHIFTHLKAIM